MSLRHLFPVLALGLVLPAHGQQEQPEFRLQVNSRLISTTLTVRDAKGKLVTNLPQTAFHIKEDGIDQTVRYYASQRELPLSIALIVDASGSQDKFVKEHEHEIEDFLKEVMEPRDRAFAICFGNHLRLVSDWTSTPGEIIESVHRFNKGERNFPELGSFYLQEVITRGHKLVRKALERGVNRGELRPVDCEYATRLVFAPLVLQAIWRHSFDFCGAARLDPDIYIEQHLDILLRGLMNETTGRSRSARVREAQAR